METVTREPRNDDQPPSESWWCGQRVTGILMAVVSVIITYIVYMMGL